MQQCSLLRSDENDYLQYKDAQCVNFLIFPSLFISLSRQNQFGSHIFFKKFLFSQKITLYFSQKIKIPQKIELLNQSLVFFAVATSLFTRPPEFYIVHIAIHSNVEHDIPVFREREFTEAWKKQSLQRQDDPFPNS